MPERRGSTLWDFAKAMFAGWFTRMSGPLSVPAAIAAAWVSSGALKLLLGLTAFICLWATAYLLWKTERSATLTEDDASYGLDIQAQADDQFMIGDKLNCYVLILSKSAKTLEFENLTMSVIFAGDDTKTINGTSQILRPQQSFSWSLASNAIAPIDGNGFLLVNAQTDYGLLGRPKTRRLEKSIQISYTTRNGIVMQSNARTTKECESAIGA